MLVSVLKLNLAVEAMEAATMIVTQVATLAALQVAIPVVTQAAKLYAVLATITTTQSCSKCLRHTQTMLHQRCAHPMGCMV